MWLGLYRFTDDLIVIERMICLPMSLNFTPAKFRAANNLRWFLANVNLCCRPSVCRLSVCLSVICLSCVTFAPPIQPVEIFGNILTQFGTLAIRWYSWKVLRRSSQGNPSVGGRGLNARGVAKYIAILDLLKAISRKRCKIKVNLVLMTNRKSYMTFRLVPKSSVTLNDPERRNGPYFFIISPNSWRTYLRHCFQRNRRTLWQLCMI